MFITIYTSVIDLGKGVIFLLQYLNYDKFQKQLQKNCLTLDNQE